MYKDENDSYLKKGMKDESEKVINMACGKCKGQKCKCISCRNVK